MPRADEFVQFAKEFTYKINSAMSAQVGRDGWLYVIRGGDTIFHVPDASDVVGFARWLLRMFEGQAPKQSAQPTVTISRSQLFEMFGQVYCEKPYTESSPDPRFCEILARKLGLGEGT